MKATLNIKDILTLIIKTVKYNLKIIFANRFIWFLIISLAVYLFFSFINVYNGNSLNETTIYGILLVPGLILIIYPTIYGIQNDDDASILEILFGIPNYRYKIWLLRILITYFAIFIMLLFYAWLSSIILAPLPVLEMAGQLMFPIIFLGSLSFMFSTIIRSGMGTAAIMALIAIALLFLSDTLERTQWNIFLNPFNLPDNFNEIIWEGIVIRNRIFLAVGIVVSILFGLYNLQKREKFV